jgi:glycosyltransferase involved in cell wall biosynthesis
MISVVIPTHNRRSSAVRALEALTAQKGVAGKFEVVVVVDGSKDDTAAAISGREWPFPLTLVEQSQKGLAAARNAGANRAGGEFLLFLDDDMIPQPTFLREIFRSLSEGVDGVLTTVRQGAWMEDNLITREIRSWEAEIHQRAAVPRIIFLHIHFCAHAIRRGLFEDVGGFDESFTSGGRYGNEDIELGHRLLLAGANFVYCSEAVAETEAVVDPDLILRRARESGENDVYLIEKHPALLQPLFRARLGSSHINRIIAPIVLRAPWVNDLVGPLKKWALHGVRSGNAGKWMFRLWFTIRAIEYWAGVARTRSSRAILGVIEERIAHA